MMGFLLGRWNHWSDCALHNAPAFAPEPCDCGNTNRQRLNEVRNKLHFVYWRALFHMGRT